MCFLPFIPSRIFIQWLIGLPYFFSMDGKYEAGPCTLPSGIAGLRSGSCSVVPLDHRATRGAGIARDMDAKQPADETSDSIVAFIVALPAGATWERQGV